MKSIEEYRNIETIDKITSGIEKVISERYVYSDKLSTSDYKQIAERLTPTLEKYNYYIKPLIGKPGVNENYRQFRLQLIDPLNDTSAKMQNDLQYIIKSIIPEALEITYNSLSPNSGKYPSVEFKIKNQLLDSVIASGSNRGEKYEKRFLKQLSYAIQSGDTEYYDSMLQTMHQENPKFIPRNILSVHARTGTTFKSNIKLEELGSVIGDVVLLDKKGNEWYVSVKGPRGYTFANHGGASSLFDWASGELNENSEGADFLKIFGVDLNLVQAGFDERNPQMLKNGSRKKFKQSKADPHQIENIFQSAWGMNYFYVRDWVDHWEIYWIDRAELNKRSKNIRVTDIRYPSTKSKQITILCQNSYMRYVIEVRHSKGGEYPNDIKFRTR